MATVQLAAMAAPVGSPVTLFNGRDLEGFHSWLVDLRTNDARNVFSVTNGQLRISGEGLGYLGTKGSYSNYLLRVEYRWGQHNHAWGDRIGKARDSGVFLHSMGPDGNSHDGHGAFKAAIECNIFQGAVGDLLLIRGTNEHGALLSPGISAEVAADRDADGWYSWQPGGRKQTIQTWGRLNHANKDPAWRDVMDATGRMAPEKPTGEWNKLEIECSGNRITVWLNGIKVNEAFDAHPTCGSILLQCEGSEIFFRRVELAPLVKSSETGLRAQ